VLHPWFRGTRFELFRQSQAFVDAAAADMVVAENIRPYFIVWGTQIAPSIPACRRTYREAQIIAYIEAV
jgi:hypothetical protein